MRPLAAVLLVSFVHSIASGQTYAITTFAGGGLPVNIPGTSASLVGPQYIAADREGDIFFVDQGAVFRLDAATGLLTLAAGNGTTGFGGDNGPATSAQLYEPAGLAVDSGGNLYIADSGNNRVLKVSNGVITTVAGNGTAGFSGDNGPATTARLNNPIGVAVDAAGNLYIVDGNNQRIRKISNGVIATVAGDGNNGFSGDGGPATSAYFDYPAAIAVDAASNLYIADSGNSRIRMVSNGVISTVAGGGGQTGDNVAATSASLSLPIAVAVNSAGDLYITDETGQRIRKVSNGVIVTAAGNGETGVSADGGPAASASLDFPAGIAVDAAGNLYIADTDSNRIRKVANGVITTVAGNGIAGFSGDGGPATSAQLDAPEGVAVDSAGNLYIADTGNNSVRKVANGVIVTVAGNATGGFSGDNGPATSAQLRYPIGLALDLAGNLFIADSANNSIREVSNGVIASVAGGGELFGDNGPATGAELFFPEGVALDISGNLYIADTAHDSIRMVSHGVITTVAGNGTPGFGGDNGPAAGAQLYNPGAVAVDSAGNLYIADTLNNRIRKVSNGVIATVAGSGTPGFSGDGGPSANAQLFVPEAVAVDSGGNLYVADWGNNRVRAALEPVSVRPLATALYGGQTQQFTATVTNAGNTSVTWTVSPNVGTVSANGLYTAPAIVGAQQTVTVTATSNADNTKTATATITLYSPVTISVSPASATLAPNQTQQFTAMVGYALNTSVTWTASPSNVGTIGASGLYTAPATTNAQQTVTVTATSNADNTKTTTAPVNSISR